MQFKKIPNSHAIHTVDKHRNLEIIISSEKGESWRQAKSAWGLWWEWINPNNPQKRWSSATGDEANKPRTVVNCMSSREEPASKLSIYGEWSATPPNEELACRLFIKLPYTRLFHFSRLRNRILTLFLQYCKTPIFNHKAARIIKVQ